MRFSWSAHLLIFLSLETLMSIIRTGLPILVKLIDLVNSAVIFLSQMTLVRWLTFLLGSQTVILIILLFWINSQTCLYDHLYKMTTPLRRPMLSPLKPVFIQLLLYKMTTRLTWLATTIFVPQRKKNLSKTTTAKLNPVTELEAMNKKYLSYCIYFIATL